MIKGYHTFILRRIPSKQLIVLLDNSYSQEIQDIKNRIWSALIKEPIKDVKPKLSNLLFDAVKYYEISLSYNKELINLANDKECILIDSRKSSNWSSAFPNAF